jgi:oligopeptidase B
MSIYSFNTISKLNAKKIQYPVYFGYNNNHKTEQDISISTQLMNPPIIRNDDYFWIRDETRKNKDILNLINLENNYTKSIMETDTNKKIYNEIYNELKSYMKEDYKTYPFPINSCNSNYKYFKEYKEGSGYFIYKRLDINTNEEIILLDVNELAKDKQQCDVTSISHNLNEEYFSYCVDYDGSEKYILFIEKVNSSKNIDTSEIGLLTGANYQWINDDTIIYTKADDANRPFQLWSWNIQTKENLLLYNEVNFEMSISFYTSDITLSNDMKYIFISSANYDSNVIYWINMNDITKCYQFHPYVSGLQYNVYYHSGYFYIRTNCNNSTNWKICKIHISKYKTLACHSWPDFISYNENVYIESMLILQDYLIFISKVNGASYINIINILAKKYVYTTNLIDFNQINEIKNYHNESWSALWPKSVYTISFYNNIYNSNYLYLILETMTEPSSIIKYNLDNLTFSTVYTKEVPNYDSSLYKSERIYVELDNNIKVPISLIYHKDKFKQDGSNPLYLYGYGAYGITVDPTLTTSIIPLLNCGYVYAIAHVRGGSFLGYKWYEDGKLKNKINSFTDFIACTEHLINKLYTNPKSITIDGRSAGGLLVGAVMTMRPDLYKNVIMGVPFVDVLNTMSDASIPLTVEEWSQWGNPNIKEYYDYISLYCPYTNLKKTNYPNVYIITGLYDPRVQYWEPLKFISKLRELKTDNHTQLIKINTQQGHFGGSDRYKYLQEYAEQYTFVLSM